MDNPIGKNDILESSHLLTGAALLIDKPSGWTSFDVVNKLRWAIRTKLGVRKYKVGHAGTLDPLATGLLIICISKYTKRIEEYVGQPKSYTGEVEFFKTTPTYDAEMLPDCYFPYSDFNLNDIQTAVNSFKGEIEQRPPIFSALKKNGVPMYKLARKGKEVEMKTRPVTIYEYEVGGYADAIAEISVRCSKGTYIRSLAYDLGQSLGTGAYLRSLRRTAIGDFSVEDALDIDAAVKAINEISL
ncbi:MAG: tRNA pseudouridine55 synthase [Saprospiraceae bacterium]|jgi:tRNA pseudouridine55 synthase